MSLPFADAARYFERATQAARRHTHTIPIQREGQRRYDMQAVPKEQRAALRAAFELMNESATTQDERRQVSEARIAMKDFRGPPPSNPMVAAVDAMNMNGRTRRIKREMVQRRW